MTEMHPHTAEEANAGHLSESEPVARFVEQMGLLCEHDNLPRIAGRVLGLLIVEEGAFSLRELADRLKVSRASVSTNARILADVGLIDRVGIPGDRQDYYQLAANPFERMLSGKVAELRQGVRVFEEAAKAFPRERMAAISRLREMADFHRMAADTVTELIERSVKPRR